MRKFTQIFSGFLLLTLILSLIFVLPVGATTNTNASTSQPETMDKGVKIMTYNVMDDVSANSDGTFPYASPAEREDAIAEMIKVYAPDVIGMQEAGDGGVSGILDWCAALNEDLKDIYAYRSITDETGLKMDICRGLIIFYNKSRFTLLESGGQGYSQPANNKRCFHWVLLRDEETDVEFYVFNTHWHVDAKITLEENEVIRTAEMQELADKVNTLAKDRHCILTGDFNSFYSPKNSMGDTKNITRLQENTGFVDALLSTEDMTGINAKGTATKIEAGDNGLMISADHVIYAPKFYTPVKLQRILSRTYSPKLSDHDAFLVHFAYKRPELSAKAEAGNLDAYFSNGAYYIDNLSKRSTDLPIEVSLSQGEIYTDEACTKSAGSVLTIKNATSNTYMGKNTYYIKFGNLVYPLYLRSCNSNHLNEAIFVDPSFKDKAVGSAGLYCDKWYCRPVTVGVNGFATIQEAVDAAQDGYRVMVAPGTYTEDVTYTGKSIDFYGSNRNSSKALVLKDGQLTVNTGRTYETYLSGSITFAFGNLQNGSLMVNGFHFIDSTATGQIRITGGNAGKTVDLRICNNLFNCYTDGAVNNGSAIHCNTALQKTGSIEDNYFHLTETPSYTDSTGATVNYTNRAITMRNMKDMTIHANYFHGYTGSKIRPFWLSSEVSSESTVSGYGNLAFTGNRLEDSVSGSIYINNIREETNANLLIADNSYGGEKVVVDFRETTKQTTAKLPTDKSKITFSVQAEDLPNLTVLPAGDTGITTETFAHYVTFRNDKGDVIFAHAVVTEKGVEYTGPEPWKEASDTMHYSFKEWVDADGNAVALSKISTTMDIYGSYTETSHTLTMRDQVEATCTEDGFTGNRDCSVCGHVVKGQVIPAKGHTVITEKGYAPTCTGAGLTDASHCSVCKTVLAIHEPMDALGHDYDFEVTLAPTLTEEGLLTYTCKNDPSHSYTEKAEMLDKALYFTFDNDEAAQERYHNYVYNYQNFDLIRAWKGRTQSYQEGFAQLDAATGSLTVKPGVTDYGSIFADSVNLDLNYDPQYAEYFQIRFKAKGFTGTSCKVGMYFYYGTDNSYVAGSSVSFTAEVLTDGEYRIATGKLADRVRNLDEVNRVVIYLSGFNAPADLDGELTFDYIYAGPYATLPTPYCTVTFADGDGKILQTQQVYRGEAATYTGSTPTKSPDQNYHYSFRGWDKPLTNIPEDILITATFTSTKHSFTYESTDSGKHSGLCSCGYEKEEAHSYTCKVSKEPTTEVAGTLTGSCSACKAPVTVTLPKLNTTDYSKTTTAATCTSDGKDTYTWKQTVYGTFHFEVSLPATGHAYSYSVTKAPTESATGTLWGTCSNCAGTTTISLPKLNTADYSKSITTAPTCTADGTSTYTWNNTAYGSVSIDVTVAKLGHTYDTGVITTVPTFTEKGTKTFTCGNDSSHTYTESVDVLNKSLYFTFDNGAAAQKRYHNYVYNFANFDLVDAWRGRTQGYKEGSALVDSAAGTLTVKPGVTGFGSIFADSVNLDLNYDPEYAEYFQIRFKATGFTGSTFKVGMYFYYSTDNSYVAGNSVTLEADVLKDGAYFLATGELARRVRNLDEVNRVIIYLSGIESATDLSGELTFDYIYAGPYSDLPTPIAPVEDPNLKLSHSLNLASDISVNFVVPKTLLTGFDMSTVYVESTIDMYEGNNKVGTKTVRLEGVDNGYTYYFTLNGLTAVQMNNRIRSVIYGTRDGQAYCSPIDDYSIADYAYSQLNKTNTTDKLRTLCADLLRYGAKAQIYKNYRTESLVDSAMTDAHSAYLSDIEAVTFGNVNEDLQDLANPAVTWVGKSLNLDSKVCLKFVFKTTASAGKLSDLCLRVSYKDRNGEVKTAILTESEVYNEATQLYSFTVDSLLAAELRSVVSVQIYAGETPVSTTLRYSPDTYGNGKTGTLLNLCKALFAYSDSAKAYFTA
ncbi:MAG: endonuclease/exonuclease/phosphatase family protein [Oscillospiraceae bacterium]|nr:endonuclease/exonuclease/phosphatase family protein [Oscillospiraceae bacterium]